MGFGKPIDPGQGLGRKNLAESLKWARPASGNTSDDAFGKNAGKRPRRPSDTARPNSGSVKKTPTLRGTGKILRHPDPSE